MTGAMNARAIAAVVEMPRLLAALGFEVSERTRRTACPLHHGSNPSAFSWTDSGMWKCHACGAGGDRIALVRAARKCSFREAVKFLAALTGIEYRAERISREEIERTKAQRDRIERAAWALRDEEIRLLSHYRDGLHRAERLMARLGEAGDAGTEALWEPGARLAPAQTFFLAAYTFMYSASRETIARFVLASPAERRQMIIEGEAVREQCSAT